VTDSTDTTQDPGTVLVEDDELVEEELVVEEVSIDGMCGVY
jgi:mycofactocin precursor